MGGGDFSPNSAIQERVHEWRCNQDIPGFLGSVFSNICISNGFDAVLVLIEYMEDSSGPPHYIKLRSSPKTVVAMEYADAQTIRGPRRR